MRKKQFWVILAAACAAVFAVVPVSGGDILTVLALPFTAAGAGLRALSLSGGAGNAAAIVLYLVLCLSPLALKGKRRWQREDWLLVLGCGVMAWVLYLMVNPGQRPPLMNSDAGDFSYAGCVWSVLAAWGVLKLMRSGEHIRQANIYKALRIFLLIWAVQCVVEGFGLELWYLRSEIAYLNEVNTATYVNLWPSYLFAGLDFAAAAAEEGMLAVVLTKGIGLLEALEQDPYGEECVQRCHEAERWCRQMLVLLTLISLALNLGQMMFCGLLHNMRFELRLPVLSLAVAFGMLALTRLLSQGKALKDDNDLFI